MAGEGKSMARISAKELRANFVTPLSALLKRLNDAAQELEKLEDSGVVPFLPANHKEASNWIGFLETWVTRELEAKIDGAKKGSSKVKQAIANEQRKEKQNGK